MLTHTENAQSSTEKISNSDFNFIQEMADLTVVCWAFKPIIMTMSNTFDSSSGITYKSHMLKIM